MDNIEETLQSIREGLQGGRADAARLALLQLLQQHPDHPTALLMLGGVYFHEHKYAEAQLAYERLVRLEPGSGMLSIALFNSLWRQGRHEDAAAEIHRFILAADPQRERHTIEQYAAISQAIANGAYGVGE